MRRLVPVLACVLVVFACTDDPGPPTDGDDGGATTVMDPEAACTNEAGVVDSAEVPAEGVLTGDIDGDDTEDTIYLATDSAATDAAADAGCRSFLIATTETTIYSAPVDPSGNPRATEPSLNSLIQLDFEPGREIVVNLEAGASTQFVGVFKVTAEGIERITLDGRGPGPFAQELARDNLFPFGGSVGHLEAVDCLNPGLIVMSAAIPMGDSADRYEVERRFFRLDGTVLKLHPESTEVHEVEGLTVDRFREFAGSPFLSCT
jgi:hypothetical protein